MKLIWQIDDEDVRKARHIYKSQKNNPFVLRRITRNVKKNIPGFKKEIFWEAMISCLITTQQRSGPNSNVTKLINTKPFPLNYSQCAEKANLEKYTMHIISQYGLRRGNKIGEEVEHNYGWLQSEGWSRVKALYEELYKNNKSKKLEREAAEIMMSKLKGFGPKQSRNLLQSLGLTIYEVPIDSRIVRWLKEIGFPLKSAGALSDSHFYNFILDAFQDLCEKADVYPCMMDAAIFSSFDRGWTEDNVVW